MLGKLGGIILACMNATFARCVIRLLDLQPRDKVLEVGPDVAIQLPAKLGPGRRRRGRARRSDALQEHGFARS
jgi:hypothetical protein